MAETSIPSMLRPLAVADVFDVGFQIYRRWWKPLLTVSALLYLPYTLLTTGGTFLLRSLLPADRQQGLDVSSGGALLTTGLGMLVWLLVVYPILLGMICWLAAHGFLGRPVGLLEAWARVRQRLWILIGASLLETALIIGGTLCCCLPGLAAGVLLACIPCVVVMEERGVVDSLTRSYHLTRGLFWKAAGILILSSLLVYFISGVFQIPVLALMAVQAWQSASSAAAPLLQPQPSMEILNNVAASLGALVVEPLRGAILVLMYYDLRIRQEAFDLQLLAESLGYQASTQQAICGQCERPNPTGTRFCLGCGHPLGAGADEGSVRRSEQVRNCAGCGAPLRANARFCTVCGAPVNDGRAEPGDLPSAGKPS